MSNQDFSANTDASKIRRFTLLTWSRLVLAVLLFASLVINNNLQPDAREPAGALTPVTVSALYAFVALAAIWTLYFSQLPWRGQLFGQALSEVVLITLLVISLGGSGGGYVILYIMPIALSASLLGWMPSMLICSVSVLALLADGVRCSVFLAQQVNWLLIGVQGLVSFAIMALLRWAAIHENAREKQYRQASTQSKLLQEVRDQHLVDESIGWLVLNEQNRVQLFNTPARTLAWQANVILEVGLIITADSALAPWLAATVQLGDTYVNWPPASVLGKPEQGASKAAKGGDQLLLHSSSLPHMVHYKALTMERQSERDAKAQQQQLAAIGRLSASIAHEIRNPLAAISQAAQLLQENASQPVLDAQLLAMVINNAQRIERIVTHVLGWSRGANAHPDRIAPAAQLSALLPELITSLRLSPDTVRWQDASTANASQVPRVSQVLFDTDHFYQIVSNFLSNASRFASGKPASIALHLRQRGAYVALLVLDDGLAVDQTVLNHLFEPFVSASKQGTGLGLFLCNEFARANQGSIQLMQAGDLAQNTDLGVEKGVEKGAENWVQAPYTKAFVLNMPLA